MQFKRRAMAVINLRQKKFLLISSALIFVIIFIIILLVSRIGFVRLRLCDPGKLLFIDKSSGNSSCHLPRNLLDNPCPQFMILVPLVDSPFTGICQCDNINHNRTLVYHKESDKCYFVFTQGYCAPGHWLTLEEQMKPVCEPNYCLDYKTHDFNHLRQRHSSTRPPAAFTSLQAAKSEDEWVPLSPSNSCALLGHHHPTCHNGTDTDTTDVIRFFKRKLYPACSSKFDDANEDFVQPERTVFAGVGVPQNDCPDGFIKTQLGLCAVEFDYMNG